MEEGLVGNGKTSCMKYIKMNNSLKRIIECVKLILLLEMLLCIGWGCYTMWQNCHIESMEVKAINNIPESENLFTSKCDKCIINAVEQLNKSNDILTKNMLKPTEISNIDNETDANINGAEDNLQNVEDDLLLVINNDKKSALEDAKYFVDLPIENDNLNSTEKEFKENLKIDESTKYDKDSSDTWTNESSERSEKEMRQDVQRNLENYSIFLLILENSMRNTPVSDSSTTEDNYNLEDFKVSNEWLNKEFTDENRKVFTSESHMDVDNTGEKSEEKIISMENPINNEDVNQNEMNDEWNQRQIISEIMENDYNDMNIAFNEKKNISDNINISDLSNYSPYIYYPDYLYDTY